MIDSEFIIRYTNGLYSTPIEHQPRYDEFRDMFSFGQLASKEWLISELTKHDIGNKSVLITGAWFGTLGVLLKKIVPTTDITLVDIDPRCEVFLRNITHDISGIKANTADMYGYVYQEDIIVNTSCEHIGNVGSWLGLIPKNTTVVLQSNNFTDGSGHINCAYSKEDFLSQTNLSEVWYIGELVMPMYTRYMIIGKV